MRTEGVGVACFSKTGLLLFKQFIYLKTNKTCVMVPLSWELDQQKK